MSKVSKKEKRKLRNQRKKENKKKFIEEKQKIEARLLEDDPVPAVEIEYVITDPLEQLQVDPYDPFYQKMKQVIEMFNPVESDDMDVEVAGPEEKSEEEVVEKKRLSRKKKKLLTRMPVAVLKQLVDKPDLVEVHDTSSSDPFLLVHFKSTKNAVPVPAHWSQKRKYLQGKRGIEKTAFELPHFIAQTGIMELRNPGSEHKTLKAQMRERMNPTLGKIDIDYQVLHDAFFVHQTKPKMTIHGDLYYEGKEYEVEMREKRPGVLSKELRVALGMPEGAPPPWLRNMHSFGPPPSYPKLKIPGLTAPAPPNGDFGGYGYSREQTNYYMSNHWGAVHQEAVPEMEVVMSDDDSSESVTGMETDTIEEESGIETPLWAQKY